MRENSVHRISSFAALLATGLMALSAQPALAADKPYQVEWVYHVQYGHQGEWWKIFQKYQVAILDREKQLGFVTDRRAHV